MKTTKLRTVSWYVTHHEDYDPAEDTRFEGTRVWIDNQLRGIRFRVRSREINIFWI